MEIIQEGIIQAATTQVGIILVVTTQAGIPPAAASVEGTEAVAEVVEVAVRPQPPRSTRQPEKAR